MDHKIKYVNQQIESIDPCDIMGNDNDHESETINLVTVGRTKGGQGKTPRESSHSSFIMDEATPSTRVFLFDES